jgi:(3,5-dihydroxyphenyl)acetyl-CoA 1,2-dioxygenase
MSSIDASNIANNPSEAVTAWRAAEPRVSGDFARDRHTFSEFWQQSRQIIDALPPKSKRDEAQTLVAGELHRVARQSREQFLQRHVEAIYHDLTRNFSEFVRAEKLVRTAADVFPGLVPSARQIAAEEKTLQGHKEGLEIDQGIFLAQVLGHERTGRHLVHAMLLPRAESPEHLRRFQRDGVLDVGAARLERHGESVHLIASNPRFLNAEDQTTIDNVETAVDVAILDNASNVAVLRGTAVEHPKYRGRRLLGSGINLTHLYQGRIPFVWFIQRELGFVHKFLRGVASPDVFPDDVHGTATEKPWVAAVEGFAIGGHCQVLLTMDFVVAASDAFMTLPARKEGIIPGVSNLRLPRFTGDRIARQAIQYERRIDCDSPEGRLICDEIALPDAMDSAIDRVVGRLASSGAVGAIANRRAFRVGEEPIDMFRAYMAVYAREQAYCHFSPALIANLEQYWNAQNRKG